VDCTAGGVLSIKAGPPNASNGAAAPAAATSAPAANALSNDSTAAGACVDVGAGAATPELKPNKSSAKGSGCTCSAFSDCCTSLWLLLLRWLVLLLTELLVLFDRSLCFGSSPVSDCCTDSTVPTEKSVAVGPPNASNGSAAAATATPAPASNKLSEDSTAAGAGVSKVESPNGLKASATAGVCVVAPPFHPSNGSEDEGAGAATPAAKPNKSSAKGAGCTRPASSDCCTSLSLLLLRRLVLLLTDLLLLADTCLCSGFCPISGCSTDSTVPTGKSLAVGPPNASNGSAAAATATPAPASNKLSEDSTATGAGDVGNGTATPALEVHRPSASPASSDCCTSLWLLLLHRLVRELTERVLPF